jgi:hypothetical protein
MEVKISTKRYWKKVQLSDSVCRTNHAVYLDVKQYLANQRQGTQS